IRQSGQRVLEGHALAAMGGALASLGKTSEAAACYASSLDIRREAGDRKGEAWMLYHLAAINLAGDSPMEAAAFLEQSRSIAAEAGDERLNAAIDNLNAGAGGVAHREAGNAETELVH